MDSDEQRNKRLKEKEDSLTNQLDEDTDDRPGRGVGLPENVRVVYGEEHNPSDG